MTGYIPPNADIVSPKVTTAALGGGAGGAIIAGLLNSLIEGGTLEKWLTALIPVIVSAVSAYVTSRRGVVPNVTPVSHPMTNDGELLVRRDVAFEAGVAQGQRQERSGQVHPPLDQWEKDILRRPKPRRLPDDVGP